MIVQLLDYLLNLLASGKDVVCVCFVNLPMFVCLFVCVLVRERVSTGNTVVCVCARVCVKECFQKCLLFS